MPEAGATQGPYSNQRTRLLRNFDKITRESGKRVLESHYNSEFADTVLKESRREYESLIPVIPDIGGRKTARKQILSRALSV